MAASPTGPVAPAPGPTPVAPAPVATAAEPVSTPVGEPVAATVATLAPVEPEASAPDAVDNPTPDAVDNPTPDADEPVASLDSDIAPVIRTTPPAVIVPALGDVTSGPETLTPAEDTDSVPAIREATPVTPQNEPALPSVQAPVPIPASAAPYEFESQPASASTRSARRGKHRASKLLVTLVVLGGLVAAAVVFGEPYLFPSDWNAATEPYAEAVEESRGVEFVEPLTISGEPSVDFTDRMRREVAGDVADQLPSWRALGLAVGDLDDQTLAERLAGWQDALYAASDGQVYHDQGAAGPDLDAQLTRAMAAASLDQEFRWSSDQPQRSLDAAAATSAEVLAQSRRIQIASTYDAELATVAPASVDELPAIVGYRMLAPRVFAEFVAPESSEPNPLDGLDTAGPGRFGSDTPTPAVEPNLIQGDVLTTSPVAMDRSFWFLVFGSFLDAPTAFAASEAVVENSITGAVRGETPCVYATFSGTAVQSTDTLRSALQAWSNDAPAEFASSFSVLPDGSLQLSSCDPGAAFASPVRPGVVRELVAWRAAELATYDAVTAAGGSDADVDGVWGLIGASDVPLSVAALPASTSPAEIAAAARTQVATVYTP